MLLYVGKVCDIYLNDDGLKTTTTQLTDRQPYCPLGVYWNSYMAWETSFGSFFPSPPPHWTQVLSIAATKNSHIYHVANRDIYLYTLWVVFANEALSGSPSTLPTYRNASRSSTGCCDVKAITRGKPVVCRLHGKCYNPFRGRYERITITAPATNCFCYILGYAGNLRVRGYT